MENPIIPPIIPNIGNTEAAGAANAAAIFTAADRKIIEARGGEVDRNRTFLDVFKDKPLMPQVENEQTPIQPDVNPKDIQNRQRIYRAITKNSALYVPAQDKVEIIGALPDTFTEQPETPPPKEEPTPTNELSPEAAAIARELNLNPTEMFDRFSLEQEELTGLIYRIKDLHLKRLLTEDEKEFNLLSQQIKEESLHNFKPEARPWFESQLEKLTAGALEYKLGILDALQAIAFDHDRDKIIAWLKKCLKAYAPAV